MTPRDLGITAAAATAMLVAGWLWLGRKDAPSATPTPMPSGGVTLAGAPRRKDLAPKSTARAYSAEASKAARRSFILQNAAGLTAIPRAGGAIRVNLALKTVPSTPKCSAGDVEAISFDVRESRKNRLLLTAEPLAGDAFAPVTRPLALKNVKAGFATTIELPSVAKPTTVGFYLCKDSTGKGSCGGKTVKSINDVLNTYMDNSPKARQRFDASDKVYFFAFGVLTKDGVMIFPDTQATQQRYDALAKYLISQGSAAADANQAVQRVKDVNDKLNVLAPVVAGNNLTMPLAYGHFEQCTVKKTAH